MTNILKGHFEHVANVTIMVQNAGATPIMVERQ